jgi:DNA-binding NtrC family response regulator
MNASTDSASVYGPTRELERKSAGPNLLKRPILAARLVKTAAKRFRAGDRRISSLKVLAATLLNEIESLEKAEADDSSGLNLQAEVRRFEAELIRNALIKTGGRQRRAASLLGMKVPTLNRKIKQYGIDIG